MTALSSWLSWMVWLAVLAGITALVLWYLDLSQTGEDHGSRRPLWGLVAGLALFLALLWGGPVLLEVGFALNLAPR